MIDLFGNEIIQDAILREEFIEPPFSVLDTKSGTWQRRKKEWLKKGIRSEVGRDAKAYNTKDWVDGKRATGNIKGNKLPTNTSVFDPALCEVLCKWFCPPGGLILDPFAGGSVRGIVANYLGYKYTGIDIRPEQIQSNREQAVNILPFNNQPQWYVGDSNEVLDTLFNVYDMVFSCPPYGNLEVYSDLTNDISNMDYADFLTAYKSIINKSCQKLKEGHFAVFVVGEFRDKKGDYYGFVSDTIRIFKECGMKFYNEAILLNSLASAPIRAAGNMKSKKLVKVHQNILVFKK